MPLRRNMNINDVYEQEFEQRIMARMKERLDQFVDQLADRMNDMMNPRRRGDRNCRRSEGEESENPFFEGDSSSSDNPLLTKETESEPIIWDIGDEKEEYPFVDNYLNFQEDEYNLSFSGVKEESMPVYDTDIEDVIEEEEVFVGKGGFGGEEDNIEDFVVMANDLCSSMIQTTLSVDFEEDINTKSHELMSFGKSIIIKVSQSSFKFLIGKKYQEWYLKVAPMDDKLDFKTIKVRGRVVIKKGNLMQGIQI
ncbi:hypothetical protein Tco_0625140 [Tanacetum coccineum]|uniref:Uncharacterized protein n=1 Tax=Tanacetum coccineum TaxID=301880 RepID=A0ABQ4WFZ8_9ASTR